MNGQGTTWQGSPKAWLADDLAGANDWILRADPNLAAFSRKQLQRWCAPVHHQLVHGYGVVLIRGLASLSEPAFRELFLAIGRCLGTPNTTYGLLYDVLDSGKCFRSQAIPVSQTREATSMHTDSSRLETHPRWVGLACVQRAMVGGASRVASALAVHRHLEATAPASLQQLGHCFHRDVVTPGVADPLALIAQNSFPVFAQASDGPTLRYMRYWIEKGHERLGKPLSAEEQEAFNLLDAALNAPQFCHRFAMEEGDILLLDNHKLAHDREAYEDDPERPRHMIRLWLDENP